MRILRTGSVLVFLLSAQAAVTQRPAADIQGIVVTADTNTPLPKVRVELRDSEAERVLRTTETDADGVFYFPGTPVGEYRFVAHRLGYVTAEYGQRYPSSPALSMTAAADEVVNVPIVMAQAGVITGRITDNGRGVGLADVVALRTAHIDGQLQTTMVVSDRTNDLGEYHLYWLPPGDYIVVAVVWDTASGVPNYVSPDGDDSNSFYQERRSLRAVLNRATGSGVAEGEAHIPVYYPGTTDPLSATPVRVASGGEVREINIDASPRPTYRVLGRVGGLPAAADAAPDGAPSTIIALAGGTFVTSSSRPSVRLYPQPGTFQTNTAQGPSAQVLPNGAFEFPSVVPGVYTLVATSGSMSARARVEVRNGDVLNANVTPGEGYPVNGQVIVEGDAGIEPSSFRVVLRDEPPFSTATYTSSPIAEDGTFTIPQPPPNPQATPRAAAPPGTYRVLVNPILMPPVLEPPTLPAGLERAYVKSVTMGQVDVLDQGLRLTSVSRDPVVVVIGTNPGVVEGRVATTQGTAAPSVWVALIPDGNLRFRVVHKAASTDAEGRFEIPNVPPGDYRVIAWDIVEEGVWQDLGFMRQFEDAGAPVRVAEGTRSAVEVTSIPAGAY